jgi:hypothetical protein
LPASKAADKAVEFYPKESSYVIAEKTGLSQSSVTRAQRRKGKSSDLPNKRKGRNGVEQAATKPRQSNGHDAPVIEVNRLDRMQEFERKLATLVDEYSDLVAITSDQTSWQIWPVIEQLADEYGEMVGNQEVTDDENENLMQQ